MPTMMKPMESSTSTTTAPSEAETDVNMRPSIVVQQQRQNQMGCYSANQIRQLQQQQEGDGSNSQLQSSSSVVAANELSGIIQYQQQQKQQTSSTNQTNQMFDQNGLVLPKRILPSNPIGIGHQPIIRDLNRELKFNQIRGKNVLDQKTELQKAMEKLGENKRKKEAEQERMSRRTSLELRLEERAERIAKETESKNIEPNRAVHPNHSDATKRPATVSKSANNQ